MKSILLTTEMPILRLRLPANGSTDYFGGRNAILNIFKPERVWIIYKFSIRNQNTNHFMTTRLESQTPEPSKFGQEINCANKRWFQEYSGRRRRLENTGNSFKSKAEIQSLTI